MGLTQRLGVLADVFQPDSSLNVGIGGAANSSYKLQVTGTTNLTGALTGTSGSFTYADNAYGAGITVTNSTNNTAAQSKINIANSAGNMLALIQNSPSVNSGVAYIGTSGAYSLTIGTNYATNLTIASTGAATFSSSVTASGGASGVGFIMTNTTNSRQVTIGYTSGAAYNYIQAYDGTNFQPLMVNGNLWVAGNGNVGIGTSSPVEALQVTGNIRVSNRYYINDGTNTLELGANYIQAYLNSGAASTNLSFYTGTAERMRITSGGVVLIGTTSVNAISGAGSLQVAKEVISSGSSAFLGFQNRASTNFFGWYGNTNAILYNDAVGNIVSINASSGAYTATSDIRLKENINESENALDKLMQVKVKSYDWISNKNHESFGLIAQELYEILPEYTYKPEIEEENWGIAKAELVPMLIKAIQEQQEIINQLSAKVTALENTKS